jgi:hypothetical protein
MISAHEVLAGLQDKLAASLPPRSEVREIVERITRESQLDRLRSHTRGDEDGFIDRFVIPTLFDHIKDVAQLTDSQARQSLLSEHWRSIPEYSSGTPARKQLHLFTKIIGESPSEIMSRWRGGGRGPPMKQPCPDFAIRSPFPYKIVFEAKYFKRITAEAAEKDLVKYVFEAFFYRALPVDKSRPAGPDWDYDYAGLIVYDDSPNGVFKSAWDSLSDKTKQEFWSGAGLYVMILGET